MSGTNVMTLDGSVTSGSTGAFTSFALPPLTTTHGNVVVIVTGWSHDAAVTSVTSPHLTFALRKSEGPTGGPLVEYWATSAAALSGEVITVHAPGGATNGSFTAFGVDGTNISAPFDINSSLPAGALSNTVTLSTSAANTMIIGAYASDAATPGAGSGYTPISSDYYQGTEYELATAAMAGKSVTMTGGSSSSWVMIADALAQAGASPTAYALVSHASSSFASTGSTSPINTTGADLIVVGVSQYSLGPAAALSDNKGNTFTALAAQSESTGDTHAQLFYAQGPTVGTGHTFTLTGTDFYGVIFVLAFSGSGALPLDVQNGAISASFGSTLAPGSVTPSQNNSLVVSSLSVAGGPSAFANASLTQADAGVPFAAGVNMGGAAGYLIQTTAGAVNPTWTWTGSSDASAVVAVFKPATGAAPTFDYEGTSFVTHDHAQNGDVWGYCAPDSPDGRGGTNFGETAFQWWLNPFNPSTPISGVYTQSGSVLSLGVVNTPSAYQAYINGQAGQTMDNFCGALLYHASNPVSSSDGQRQLYGYFEVTTASISRIPGVMFQWSLETYDHGWPPEIDVVIYTNSDNSMHVHFDVESGITSWDSTPNQFDITQPHKWAVNWQSNTIGFYIDGVLMTSIANPGGVYQSSPLGFYLLTGAGYNASGGPDVSPSPSSLPGFANIMSVKIWNNVPTP